MKKISFEKLSHYKYVSFDLWGTLITSNPEFKTKRNEFINNFYNPRKLSKEEISNILSEISLENDTLSTITGLHIKSEVLFARILHRLYGIDKHITDYNPFPFSSGDVINLQNSTNQIFQENPPLLIQEYYLDELSFLRNQGCSLSYLSNIGLTDGNVLKESLKPTGLFDYFDSGLFSSDSDFAKPNQKFFRQAQLKWGNVSSQTVHVGDNRVADFVGALNYGYDALYVGEE
jgi:putative hydrolase of the HAD superfamily